MWLWIAVAVAIGAGLLAPLGHRFQATTLWLGKALAPPEAADAAPRGLQDAVSHGWIANLGLSIAMLPFVAAGVGLLHSWWAALGALAVAVIAAAVAERTSVAPRTLDWYLLQLLSAMQRREADYARRGDTLREEAASHMTDQLEEALSLYLDTGTAPPTMREARDAPYGMPEFLLKRP